MSQKDAYHLHTEHVGKSPFIHGVDQFGVVLYSSLARTQRTHDVRVDCQLMRAIDREEQWFDQEPLICYLLYAFTSGHSC